MSKKDVEIGSVFGNYRIGQKIGHGSYGNIYECSDLTDDSVWAIKFEQKKNNKTGILTHERDLLYRIQKSRYFPHYKDFGEDSDFRWIVMELLGPSLIGAQNCSPGSLFTLSTALRVGIESLKCIQELHEYGIIHRDIKPGNFLIRPSKRNPLVLIDFGLSRIYLDSSDQIIPPRENPGFVGTAPYASINAHKNHEHGRCDDLYSWFVILLKCLTGRLPWPSIRDKAVLLEAKLNVDMDEYCRDLPKQILKIYSFIIYLSRDDIPDYSYIYTLLAEAMFENGCFFTDPYDWEETDFYKAIKKEDADSTFEVPISIPTELRKRISSPCSNEEHMPVPETIPEPVSMNDRGCCFI